MLPTVHLAVSTLAVVAYVVVTGDVSPPVILAIPMGVLIDVDHVFYALYYLPEATVGAIKRLSITGLYAVLTNDLKEFYDVRGLVTHGAVIALAVLASYGLSRSPAIPLTLTLHFILDVINIATSE